MVITTAVNDNGYRRPKIGLIGSGQIGSVLGLLTGLKKLGDVAMYDIVEGIPEGKSLDLAHLTSVEHFDCCYTGGRDYKVLKGCDAVIITAGLAQQPGKGTRAELLEANKKVMKMVAAGIKENCPDAFVVCITNPLDAMTYLLQKESGLPANKVVGMAGVLDSSRFAYFLAQNIGVSVEDVRAMVIGQHSSLMVPLPRFSTVGGIPIPDMIRMKLITKEAVDAAVVRTQHGGDEIHKHFKTGSAFFAPAAGAVKMVEAYLLDSKRVYPCSALLNGEYGLKGMYLGVPVVIGRNGVERIIEVELNAEEKEVFNKSVAAAKELLAAL